MPISLEREEQSPEEMPALSLTIARAASFIKLTPAATEAPGAATEVPDAATTAPDAATIAADAAKAAPDAAMVATGAEKMLEELEGIEASLRSSMSTQRLSVEKPVASTGGKGQADDQAGSLRGPHALWNDGDAKGDDAMLAPIELSGAKRSRRRCESALQAVS